MRHEASKERSGDRLGELLRLADEGESSREISPERVARHKELARAHWQRKVRARTRRRRFAYGLAAAATLAVALGLWRMVDGGGALVDGVPPTGADRTPAAVSTPGGAASRPVARLSVLAGPVRRERDDAPALAEGSPVDAGALLETGMGSRAAFRLAGGHELRLDVETRLRLVSERVLALEHGAVYVDSRGAPGSLEIRTDLGTARDVGTRFEVRLGDDELRVRVRDGLVEVFRAGVRHRASGGSELTVDGEGRLGRRNIAVYGPEWRWSLEVAPAFDIEGRSLRDFLGWVTRETGWRLRLDPAVASGAGTVTLNGSIGGLAPDEALGVVLPTTGLRHRVEGGELVVEPMESPR